MGLQVRKRTKGKSGWWNGSYSSKGVGVSGSVKAGKNVTFNTGDLSSNRKTPSRLTINFGNGVRWVSYGSKKKSSNRQGNNSGSQVVMTILVLTGLFIGLFVLAVIGSLIGWTGILVSAAVIGSFFYLKRMLNSSSESELTLENQVEDDGFNEARDIYKTMSEEDIEELRVALRNKGQSEEAIQHFIEVISK